MSSVFPTIPETIRVKLGPPQSDARVITVPFQDYIKNVASSEIYPTWPENAIRANVLAQITFALNRIYNQWYPSRGYDFDITNSTRYDQYFVEGRNIFENISRIVDDMFNEYVRRPGNIEPYFTQYCNGTTSTCNGLSQWGTVDLAEQGLSPMEILQYYYGDLELVQNAPMQNIPESYPGEPLRLGDSGREVLSMQLMLNRIQRNYPGIPRISRPSGLFDVPTQEAVTAFQRVFNLTPDGIVGKATWYKIIRIFTAVKRLSELDSEGLNYEQVRNQYFTVVGPGSTGNMVKNLQYYLNVVAYFNQQIPLVAIDGIYGPKTEAAVKAFQRAYDLTPDGIIGEQTYNKLFDAYQGIIRSLPPDEPGTLRPRYPGSAMYYGMTSENIRLMQQYLAAIAAVDPNIPTVETTGYFGNQTQRAVLAFQQEYGIDPTGIIGPITWDEITRVYADLQ